MLQLLERMRTDWAFKFAALEVAALRDQAAKGDADAQAALGARLYEGSGCERNPAQAEHFLRLAAEQHHARAAFDLGEAYSRSVEDGLRLDPAEARSWFRRAAKAGHALSPSLNLRLILWVRVRGRSRVGARIRARRGLGLGLGLGEG